MNDPHERAKRNDRALGGPLDVEGGSDERRAHALTLVTAVDLGVHEDRPAAAADVAGDADYLATSRRLGIHPLPPSSSSTVIPLGAVGHAPHPDERPSDSSR